MVEAIVAHLRQISGDASLTLQKIEKGSVKLFLDGSEDGFKRIEALFKARQLNEILGIPIQDVYYVDSEPTSSSKISSKDGWDEQDEQLKEIAIKAQQHPPLTRKRQLALSQLINHILRSGRLCRPYQGQFLGIYQDIYDEALQDLLLYICQHIDKYNPERSSVIAWCNVLLERRFFKEAIPKVLDLPRQKISRSKFDKFVALTGENPAPTEILKEYIEQDSENIFKKEHIKNHPEVNFQALAMRRFSGKSWKEISAEFDINIPQLANFYYRCLNKFSKKLSSYT